MSKIALLDISDAEISKKCYVDHVLRDNLCGDVIAYLLKHQTQREYKTTSRLLWQSNLE